MKPNNLKNVATGHARIRIRPRSRRNQLQRKEGSPACQSAGEITPRRTQPAYVVPVVSQGPCSARRRRAAPRIGRSENTFQFLMHQSVLTVPRDNSELWVVP